MNSLHFDLSALTLPRATAIAMGLAVLLIGSTVAAQSTPRPADLSNSQRSKIHSGEVIVELEQGETINRGTVIGIVQEHVNDVIPLVARCWEYGDWRENVKDTSLEDRIGDDVVVCGGTAKVPFPARNRHGHFRVHNRVTRIGGTQSFVSTFKYVEDSGNLEDMFGYWILQPYGPDGEHTLLKHVLNVDIGGWLPDALVRWATRRTLPDTVIGIREQFDNPGGSDDLFWKPYDYD